MRQLAAQKTRSAILIRRLSPLLLLLAIGPVVRADEPQAAPLPRRGWLGVQLETATGSGGTGELVRGVKIRGLLPGGSGEAAGLQPGDLILAVNDVPTPIVPEVLQILKSIRGGQTVKLDLVRNGQPATLRFEMKPWPREAATADYTVKYGDVASAGGRLRTIAFIPTAIDASTPEPNSPPARRAAVLLIQGLGMASLDNPKPDEPVDEPTGMNIYRKIAVELARRGFVVMQVDKSGCGDSEGDPDWLDFDAELDGYRQALAALKARADVNPDQVFLFGHSMGGVFAPILAGETPVKGIAVYGTLVKTWLEYLLENSRRQMVLADMDWAEIDRQQRLGQRFHYKMLVEGLSPTAIVGAEPDLAEAARNLGAEGDLLFGRPHTFFQKLQALNLPSYWRQARGDVLALWGEAEFVSTREDHEWIAAIARERNGESEATGAGAGPESGVFQVVPHSTHGFSYASSAKEALSGESPPPGHRAGFTPEIITLLAKWLEART